MIRVVAVDGTDPTGLAGEKVVAPVLAEFELEHPLDEGDEVALPSGTAMVVTMLIEQVDHPDGWAQWVAVVPSWEERDAPNQG